MRAIIGKNWFVILSEFNSKDIYKIAVVMGSDSDLNTLKPAIDILREFKITVSIRLQKILTNRSECMLSKFF